MRDASRRRRARRAVPALALVVGALLCSGCGGGGTAPTPVGSTSRQTSATSQANPGSTSTTTSTTTAALPGAGRPVVTIGDKNYTEQFVLGQLYLQALRAQGFSVNITDNIGPPSVVRSALRSGSLAMYPEYLNDFNAEFTRVHHRISSRAAALRLARRWAARHQLRLLAPTPFADTEALAVTVADARRHRLRTLADLSRIAARLVIGGAAQLRTLPPGLPTLRRGYGVVPASFQALAVGDQYNDLDDGTIGAAYVNTTDGELVTGDYRVLGDPRRIFGYGNIVPVLSEAAAAKEGPAFAATIERVNRMLTLSAVRALNYAVDVGGRTPAAVAEQFLQTHGLLPPPH